MKAAIRCPDCQELEPVTFDEVRRLYQVMHKIEGRTWVYEDAEWDADIAKAAEMAMARQHRKS